MLARHCFVAYLVVQHSWNILETTSTTEVDQNIDPMFVLGMHLMVLAMVQLVDWSQHVLYFHLTISLPVMAPFSIKVGRKSEPVREAKRYVAH